MINNPFNCFFGEDQEKKILSFSDLIKKFEESGELDITPLYKDYKDLTLAMLTIITKYKDDLKIEVNNDIKEEIEGFRQLFLNKVVIKRKELR
jgi:hypothetical protein